MKNRIFNLLALALITLTFASCAEDDSCIECSFTIPMTTIEETSGEICGSDADLDNTESEWEQMAVDAGTSANCSRN